jgi:hypothetical protein
MVKKGKPIVKSSRSVESLAGKILRGEREPTKADVKKLATSVLRGYSAKKRK